MWMIGTCVNTQICHLLLAQRAAGQHALNSFDQQALGKLAFQNLACSTLLDAAGMASVPIMDLVRPFLAGQLDLVSVDHDDVVALHLDVDRARRVRLFVVLSREGHANVSKNGAFGYCE